MFQKSYLLTVKAVRAEIEKTLKIHQGHQCLDAEIHMKYLERSSSFKNILLKYS